MRLFDLTGKFITGVGIDWLIDIGLGCIVGVDDDYNYDRVTEEIPERLDLWMAQNKYVKPYGATFWAFDEQHARDIAKAYLDDGIFVVLHVAEVQSQPRLMMAMGQPALPGFAAFLT